MKRFLLGVALVLLTLGSARPASACSCRELTPQQAYDAASAVFEGRVVRVIEGTSRTRGGARERSELPTRSVGELGGGPGGIDSRGGRISENPPASTDSRVVQLHVTRAWKGVQTEDVTVTTLAAGSLCGVTFEEGSIWFVYAQGAAGSLSTDMCQRTRAIENAEADLASFGAGVTPVDPNGDAPMSDEEDPPVQAPGNRGGCASCSTSSFTGDASALLLGLFLFRRRTRVA